MVLELRLSLNLSQKYQTMSSHQLTTVTKLLLINLKLVCPCALNLIWLNTKLGPQLWSDVYYWHLDVNYVRLSPRNITYVHNRSKGKYSGE